MKKKYEVIVLFLVFITVLFGCENKEKSIVPSLDLPKDLLSYGISVESTGSDVVFSFNANVPWMATLSENWISFVSSPVGYEGKNEVHLYIQENKSYTTRTGYITIVTSDNKLSETIAIQQKGNDIVFFIDKSYVNTTANGEKIFVSVTHNIDYAITSQPDWVSQINKLTIGNVDIYTFMVDVNYDTNEREGVIIFRNNNDYSISMTIKQEGNVQLFLVQPDEFCISAKGEKIEVKVTHNTNYYIVSKPDWMSQEGKNDKSNIDTYIFRVDANYDTNEREGEIIFRSSYDDIVSVKIKQEGMIPSLSVSPSTLYFDAKSETKEFSVKSTSSWKILSSADWVKVGTGEGQGDAIIIVKAEENFRNEVRFAKITVRTTDGIIATVSIAQKYAESIFTIDKCEFNLPSTEEDIKIEITHNISYWIISQPDWVKLVEKVINGKIDVYTFRVDANNSVNNREGDIIFKNYNDVCIPVTIKQSGTKN